MKNKIFFAAIVFAGNLICSEDYMEIPGRAVGDHTRTSEEKDADRQVRLQIAQIRATEEGLLTSKLKKENESRAQAAQEWINTRALNDLSMTRLIIRLLSTREEDCKITSHVAPYTKGVVLDARINLAKHLINRQDFSYVCTDLETGKKWCHKEYWADLEDLYVRDPEAFKRASVFTGQKYSDSCYISQSVIEYGASLTPEQREKFLNIIHAIRPGIIKSKPGSLFMFYEGEEVHE